MWRVLLTILLKFWDSRNAKVFLNDIHPAHLTLRIIIDYFTLQTHSHRSKKPSQKANALSWRHYLSSHTGATL